MIKLNIMRRWILAIVILIGIAACQKPEEIAYVDEGGTPLTRAITPTVSPVFD